MTFQDYALPYGALFAIPFALTLILEPYLIALTTRWGITDEPNSRKVHSGPVAGAGGLVFYPALLAGLAITFALWPDDLWANRYLGLAIAASIIAATGLWDDMRGMKAVPKLLCQFGAGGVMYAFGYRLETVSLPFLPGAYSLGPLDVFVTILAIAAIINCINMIDGLDGLAAGSCFIMCGFLLFNRVVQGGSSSAAILVITMGISLAFLRYNFFPAKVFMGDTGSMFLGLMLAAEVLDSATQGPAVTAIMVPLAILAIPIFDMFRTVLNRARSSRHIFTADKNHLHHRLLHLGLGHRQVVILIYLLNVYMGMMAIIYPHVEIGYRGIFVFSMGLFLFLAFYLVSLAGKRNGNNGE